MDELYLDDPRSRYYYSKGWNPKALLAFGVAAAVTLPVALLKPMADAAPFSWFIGVAVAASLYYPVSARDIRQVELSGAIDAERVAREGGLV
ncbi:hypothetical protein LP418_01790 [Nocardioides sp. B-3]|nr:hypothetical protein [Nocardioides sp. B-3]UUZ61868.1 hypothetical protein LP418_01790 [Nocardioides sp. B-3]